MSREVKVLDIMSRNVVVASLEDDVENVVRKMNRFRVGAIPIVESGRPLGIITERDILVKVVGDGRLAKKVKARSIMSVPVLTIPEDASVEDAAKLMVERKVKRLAVVRGDLLVGIVASTDIVRAVAIGLLTREVYLYLSDIFKKSPLSDTLMR